MYRSLLQRIKDRCDRSDWNPVSLPGREPYSANTTSRHDGSVFPASDMPLTCRMHLSHRVVLLAAASSNSRDQGGASSRASCLAQDHQNRPVDPWVCAAGLDPRPGCQCLQEPPVEAMQCSADSSKTNGRAGSWFVLSFHARRSLTFSSQAHQGRPHSSRRLSDPAFFRPETKGVYRWNAT